MTQSVTDTLLQSKTDSQTPTGKIAQLLMTATCILGAFVIYIKHSKYWDSGLDKQC